MRQGLRYGFVGNNKCSWHLFYMMFHLGILSGEDEACKCIRSIITRYKSLKNEECYDKE